ncbi:hypothetical protein B0H34DRAFT_798981 [Crassisporium funariophilum]|nr:hypothetical protein B0H34DRAFT_798981 [Crassisporium funariophilum]
MTNSVTLRLGTSSKSEKRNENRGYSFQVDRLRIQTGDAIHLDLFSPPFLQPKTINSIMMFHRCVLAILLFVLCLVSAAPTSVPVERAAMTNTWLDQTMPSTGNSLALKTFHEFVRRHVTLPSWRLNSASTLMNQSTRSSRRIAHATRKSAKLMFEDIIGCRIWSDSEMIFNDSINDI